MLVRDIITVYCGNHTKHTNALYGKKATLLNVAASGHIIATGL
jgi:hypothetical protein